MRAVRVRGDRPDGDDQMKAVEVVEAMKAMEAMEATDEMNVANAGTGRVGRVRRLAWMLLAIAVPLVFALGAPPSVQAEDEDSGGGISAEDAQAASLYGAMHGACIGRLRQQPAHPKVNVVRSLEAQLKTAANWTGLTAAQRKSTEGALRRYLASGRPGPGEQAPGVSSTRGSQCVKLCQVLHPLSLPGWEASRAGCYGICGS